MKLKKNERKKETDVYKLNVPFFLIIPQFFIILQFKVGIKLRLNKNRRYYLRLRYVRDFLCYEYSNEIMNYDILLEIRRRSMIQIS